jgi:hypothetical protein
MLIVRDAQLDTIGSPARTTFIDATLRSLPEVFPDDPRLTDEPLMRSLIAYGIWAAAKHDIHAAREVTLFVFLVIELGPDFETRDGSRWMEPVLRTPRMSARARLDVIYARLQHSARAGGAS